MAQGFGARSRGAGGAFGTTSNVSRCAVVGCEETPKPQRCPYDGQWHRHGAVHYWCGYPESSLTFHEGDWYLICDSHLAVLRDERAAFEQASR